MSNPPPLDYEPANARRAPGLRLIRYVLIAAIFAIPIALLMPSVSRHRPVAPRLQCAANLRTIGAAIALYGEANQGLFPPDLQTLVGIQPIGLSAMVCPSSKDRAPQSANAIGNRGGCSYIYVGTDLTSKADPNCIVAIEDPANHGLEGGNVLFADAHVDWLDLREIQFLLDALNVGRNPPVPLTPNFTRAGAEQDYQQNWKPRMPQLKTGVWRIPTTQPSLTHTDNTMED